MKSALTLTQQKVLARARRYGRLCIQTSVKCRNYRTHVEGGLEQRAAEGLVALGLLTLISVESDQAQVRGRMGYRTERWTDHLYAPV